MLKMKAKSEKNATVTSIKEEPETLPMRNPPMIACCFIIAHMQVNIFIKPCFWGIYPLYKKIIIPTSRGFLFLSGFFLQEAIGKRKEFCIRSNETIKKLIPLGKKLWHTDFEFQNYHNDFFSFTIYVFILCSL